MALSKAFLPCLVASLAVACGGAVFGTGDGGDGGSSTGGNNSGGSSSLAGKPSKAGSSGKAGSSSGGSASSGGSVGTAGTNSGGGPNCEAVDCAYPVCADGAEPVTLPGQCCPSCPPPKLGCEAVTCMPVMSCGMGYTLSQPAGACCKGCVPNPGSVACPEIACPPGNHCPLGYINGDAVGGCCNDCVPDPLFCNEDSECAIADRPRPCCGCPEAISMRQYLADECWSLVSMPRPSPPQCQPAIVCDAICSPCPPAGKAACSNHHCVETGIK